MKIAEYLKLATQEFACHAKKDTTPVPLEAVTWFHHSATLTTVKMETVSPARTVSVFLMDSAGILTALTRQIMGARSVSKASLSTRRIIVSTTMSTVPYRHPYAALNANLDIL